MYRRAQILLWSVALSMGALALLAATHLGRGLADPDGFLGPAWVRLPMLIAGAFAADLIPRTLWASRFRPRLMPEMMRARIRQHWTRERTVLVITGVATFYLTYVSYRNLKSFLPALFGDRIYDRELFIIDRALFLGHPPAVVLHKVLGTDLSAHFLSTIYLWFLPLVPLALTAWLVWSRTIGYGYWFATSQCLAWSLGTASYYALPTLGPGFEYSWLYGDLTPTASSQLMEALIYGRNEVINANVLEGAVQSVAGFASLHCAITMLVAMMAHATLRSKLISRLLWANFAVTVVATLYFGWHYVADDVAGIVIALVSFYIGGVVSGQNFDRRAGARPAEAPPVLETT
ncbi:phosphatase PAP2 family protein [Nocardioides sp.]|uniref:phosphatase PAP2 family protein n=1 Tax=Nocardioides sp. TaxID=35761 RepID=UPI00352836A2